MFESFGRAFQLLKESYAVIKQDKRIMLFPVISSVISAGILISLFVFIYLDSKNQIFVNQDFTPYYPVMLLSYLAIYFVGTFFNASLMSCAQIMLNGGRPTLKDGIHNATKNLHKIIMWSLISGTISIVLRIIAERSGLIGRIVTAVIGMAWSTATFLALPIMIFEESNVIGSIKKSMYLLKKTWGENLIGQGSLGVICLVLLIPAIILVLVSIITVGISGLPVVLGLMLFYIFLVCVVISTLETVFKVALYNYAATGKIPSSFSSDVITKSFRPKK